MLRLSNRIVCQNRLFLREFKDFSPGIKCASLIQKISERHYANKINSDTKFERIYYGPLTPQIKAVKVFSLSSSAAGLIAQPIILKEASSIGSTSLLIAICSVVGFFTFVTPLLLHFITKKYVTEIYYNPETSTYKAVTINFFLASKEVTTYFTYYIEG